MEDWTIYRLTGDPLRRLASGQPWRAALRAASNQPPATSHQPPREI